MDLENTKYEKLQKNFNNECIFCGKKLKEAGLNYLYANVTPELIEYERCSCNESQKYWQEIDLKIQDQKKKEHYKEIINQFYSKNFVTKRINEYNFDNFKVTNANKKEIEIVKDYLNKCINNNQENGLIITGEANVGKTHLVASIRNELIKKEKIVLMGRLTSLLEMIRETLKSENDLIDLFSNIDMVIIDDLGTEKITDWALNKLYTIIENRNENKLPIIITTRFNKTNLLNRFCMSNDKEISKIIIQKLYQMCYGIELKR